MLAFENNSTLLIFYLIYSVQAFPHQARVLILSQNKSVSLFGRYVEAAPTAERKTLAYSLGITSQPNNVYFYPWLKFFLLPGISKTGET